jgi:isopenicillin N synthase-like dioxygenase
MTAALHPASGTLPYARRPLPVMDIGPFLAGDRAGFDALAQRWRETCETVGFMCIVGHGIAPELIARAEAEVRRFHDLPMEAKVALKVNEHQRGYIPPKATIVKHSTYHANTRLDSNETLVLATDYPADHPGVRAGRQFFGANRWPDDLPGFKETVQAFMAAMERLGRATLPIWAAALGMHEDFFDAYFADGYTYFRMAHYPPVADPPENHFGLGAHADTGFMTFLPPAKEEGLQILGEDGRWFWPEVAPDCLIVNTGQFLSRWTNDRFRATPHRVLPPRSKDRYSMACFVNTSLDAVCSVLPTCTDADHPPKYPQETYGEFFRWYMENTYPHYGKVSGQN